MDMVVHEDIGVDAAAGAVLVHGEGEEVLLEIRSILEYALFLVAADDDVVEGAGEFDAGLAGHGARIANHDGNVMVS